MKHYTLENAAGMRMQVADIGATITELHVPDRHGRLADVVLGFETLEQYRHNTPSFGCVVGRYGGRIAEGRFKLDGTEYQLATRLDGHHLHGGDSGFAEKTYAVTQRDGQLVLHAESPDGEEGYPGRLALTVTYTLTESNEVLIDYEATSSRPTVLNLTNHSYFNLRGHDRGDVLEHSLSVVSDRTLDCDVDNIPTGRLTEVAGTALDFRVPSRLGERIPDPLHQLDHSYVTADRMLSRRVPVATLCDPDSGRAMRVETTEPSLQVFTPDVLRFEGPAKQRAHYGRFAAICLEAQHLPNSPNEPGFPSTRLDPGETFRSSTCYRFETS